MAYVLMTPPTDPLSPWLRKAFSALIAERMGLVIGDQEAANLSTHIWARTQALNLPFPENYFQHLVDPANVNDPEWQQLGERLTNTESFFFRDKGQFAVLNQQLLPALIEDNKTTRTLRICSAGCSTGEEPYSLAIALDRLLPDADPWQIDILGLDINPAAIAHAQAGLYREWSFRGLDAAQRDPYFRPVTKRGQQAHYQVDPHIQKLVQFHRVNLVSDLLPDTAQALDLIICRNVFIYFDAEAIAKVINKFYQALKPGGYLLTGHSELYNQNTSQFKVVAFPQSLVFQRPPVASAPAAEPLPQAFRPTGGNSTPLGQSASQPAAPPASSQAPPTPDANAPAEQPIQAARQALQNNRPQQALKQAEAAIAQQPHNPQLLCLLAQIHAALNQPEPAIDYCQQALQADSDTLEPYYILVKIYMAQGDLKAAKRTLRKVIYLEPDEVNAYLELSQIYQREGKAKKSQLMRHTAFEIFRQQRGDP